MPGDGGVDAGLFGVVAYYPALDDRMLPTTVQPTVTFTHALDPSSVPGAFTFAGASFNPSYTTGSRTVTLVPTSPLVRGEQYTVGVSSSLRSVTGALLPQPLSFSFRPAAAGTQLSGDTAPEVVFTRLAFNASGDGMLAYVVGSGSAFTVFASRYQASTSSWLTPHRLYSADQPGDVELVSGPGATFAAVISSSSRYAFVYDGTTWSTTPLYLSSEGVLVANDVQFLAVTSSVTYVLSNGAGWTSATTVGGAQAVRALGRGNDFLLVYVNYQNAVLARFVSGGVLGSATTVGQAAIPDGGAGATISDLELSATASDYLATWVSSRGVSTEPSFTWSSAYSSSSSWSAPTLVSSSANGIIPDLSLASDGATHLLLSHHSSSGAFGKLRSGGTWGAAEPIAPAYFGVAPRLVAGPAGYAATWVDWSKAWVSQRGTSGWSVPVEASTDANPEPIFPLVPQQDGFMLAFTSGTDVRTLASTGGAFGASAEADGSAAPAWGPWLARDGTDTVLSFAQPGAVRIRRSSAGSWSTAVTVPAAPTSGHAQAPAIACLPSGEALAVWQQRGAGTNGVFASAFDGGSWSPPWLLELSAQTPSVTEDGTGFLVAWGGDAGVMAQYWRPGSGTSSPAELLSSAFREVDSTSTASNGSRFLVSWSTLSGGGGSRLSGDAGWSYAPGGSGPPVFAASNGLDFMFARYQAYNAKLMTSVFRDGGWSGDSDAGRFWTGKSHFAGGPGGYVTGDGVGTTGQGGSLRHWNGSRWVSQTVLTGTYAVFGMRFAGTADGGFLAAVEANTMRYFRLVNGTWVSASGPGVYFHERLRLAANDTGGELIATPASVGGGSRYDLRAYFQNGRTSAFTTLNVDAGTVSEVAICGGGPAFSAIWIEQDLASGANRVYGVGGL